MSDLSLFAAGQPNPGFLEVVSDHWRFCVLHFLEFAIWGSWFVVLANMLNARGFSRTDIGRIYSTIPIGSIISPLFVGYVADVYFNTEVVIGGLHLIGAFFLFLMAKSNNPRTFFWLCLGYGLAFAPTLGLVNSIIFANNDTLFDGNAANQFFWIRVFGTIGWICAGLSLKLFLDPDKPMNATPIVLAGTLSVILGVFSFFLPATPPSTAKPIEVQLLDPTKGDDTDAEGFVEVVSDPDESGDLSAEETAAIKAAAVAYKYLALADALNEDEESKGSVTQEKIASFIEHENSWSFVLSALDTDENKTLTEEELSKSTSPRVDGLAKNIDANTDGEITQAEIDTYSKANPPIEDFDTFFQEHIAPADLDGDGEIDEAEFAKVKGLAAVQDLVKRADEDKDGVVTKEEVEKLIASNTQSAAFMSMLKAIPQFLAISLVIAMCMALYFAFAGLFVEKSGVKPSNVGPVMTIGQMVEIFFLVSLPFILGANNERIIMVLTIGIIAWALRFYLFAIGRPLGLILIGVAVHGICFDFFFATGFSYVAINSPEGMAGTTQGFYAVIVYGLGMYLGSECSGWLNRMLSRKVEGKPQKADETVSEEEEQLETNWTLFWVIPAILVTISLFVFLFSIME